MQLQTKDLSDVGVTKVLRQAGIRNPDETCEAIRELFLLHGGNVTIIIGTKLIEVDVTRRCVVTDDFQIVA